MTNERKNEICDLLIEEISIRSERFMCIALEKLAHYDKISLSERVYFEKFMKIHKPENTGRFVWWAYDEKIKRIDFLKLLKTKEWTQ